jgi:XTP/dITP diphosphohydrolase
MNEKLKAIERLLNIMDELRVGCPWDKKQTFETLRKNTIEETFELADAIVNKNYDEIKGELGDLLLHIVFYSKLGDELNKFNFADVANAISEKLIYRHPHIYGDVKVANAQEVANNWEKLKLKEKADKKVLDGVPNSLPALTKAIRLQEKARGVGFDWEFPEQVWEKVNEELNEVKDEIKKFETSKNKDKTHLEAEFGDLLFSVINAARLYEIDPEIALERTNKKFINRFNYLEQETISKGISLHSMSLDEMNVIWDKAKKQE